jgi:hypothetical protein
MVRSLSDRLRRSEVRLLTLGALACAALLVWHVRDDLASLVADGAGIGAWVMFGAKLSLLEAAMMTPWVILSMLSRALLRETERARYRFAGLAITVSACLGVAALLTVGRMNVHLDAPVDSLLGEAVPALLLLTGCAVLYGGLVFLAQHGALERFSPRPSSPASPPARVPSTGR